MVSLSQTRWPRLGLICCFFGIWIATSGSELCGLPQESSNDKVTLAKQEAKELLKERSQSFLVEWLKQHDEANIVTDQDGIGVLGNPTRIKALLYESKESDGGFIVETEFRIKMPDGRTIIEFLAGIGETEEQAIDETLMNFTLSTYHVAYKAFINAEDPHQETTECMINGEPRNVLHGDTVTRSNVKDPLDGFDLSQHVREMLKDRELDSKTHWLKVVYGQHQGEVISVSVTLNNEGDKKMTEAIRQLPWPKTEGFYLTKQFVIIQAEKK